MSKIERDEVTGRETTGHEWDGIRELNTPLPRWWLMVFYGCVIWAIVYWVLYPAWPIPGGFTKGILGYSSRAELTQEVAAARGAQQVYLDQIAKTPLDQIPQNAELFQFAQSGGRSAFAVNCSPCHGAGGQGAKGYPNLLDDNWIWGGSLDQISTTITHGIRWDADPDTHQNQMPAFLADGILKPAEIDDTAEYVLSLSGRSTDKAAVARGAEIFAANCVACHGEGGVGNPEMGAPSLKANIWLYGGDKNTIVTTIRYARKGVMPAWAGRLDPATIKQLAIYVHSLGGGK